jgi:hypothetical protein
LRSLKKRDSDLQTGVYKQINYLERKFGSILKKPQKWTYSSSLCLRIYLMEIRNVYKVNENHYNGDYHNKKLEIHNKNKKYKNRLKYISKYF